MSAGAAAEARARQLKKLGHAEPGQYVIYKKCRQSTPGLYRAATFHARPCRIRFTSGVNGGREQSGSRDSRGSIAPRGHFPHPPLSVNLGSRSDQDVRCHGCGGFRPSTATRQRISILPRGTSIGRHRFARGFHAHLMRDLR